jgi:glutamyl-tRNA synthetase
MRASSDELKGMIEDQLTSIHTQRGNDYLNRVIDLLREKVTFPIELLSVGQYFFDLPSSYDDKVLRKKWNEEVSNHMNQFIDGLVDSKYSKAAQIEEHLNNYAEQNEIGKGKLMQPLRWVVSGQAGGPPIFDMLELIGIDEIKRRMDVVNEKF